MLEAREKTLGHKMAGFFKSPQSALEQISCGNHWDESVLVGKILSRLVQSVDQRVGVKQDHRKGEPAQITKYHKIPKTLAPGLIFFKGPFWGLIFRVAYIWRGLSTEGIYSFCFVLLCIWEQFPSTSPLGAGGLYLEEWLNRRFFVLWVWGLIIGGAYTCM